MNADELLSQLNDAQRASVEYCDGPSLVIAGAGSGKTRVLTYKVAYLLAQGLSPWSILVLTFTNKAADEMRDRVRQLVGESDASALWMGTFHSVFARILRIECDHIGYSRDFTIYDTQDSQSLVKQIVKEMGLDEKQYKPGMVAARISEAKNNMVSCGAYAQDYETMQRDRMQQVGQIHAIYAAYQQRLRQSNAMDFDDLLVNTCRLLKSNAEVREKYQQRFRFVLVDEYQDTNRVQHEVVKLLTEQSHRVCVVGDDAQSIYSFRGAVIDNILDFQKIYPDTRLFKLEQNYRSTQTIVGAANSLINHNRNQIHKDVFSRNAKGEPIEILEAYSDKEEASIVMRRIRTLLQTQRLAWSDFAILYRTNAQSRTFEEEFRRQGMPYRIVGGFSFYQRKEVKDAVAYLRLAVNPNDETSLRRVINYPTRGIGNTTLQKVSMAAAEAGVPLYRVVAAPEQFPVGLNAATCARLKAFSAMIEAARQLAEEKDAYEVATYIIKESGLWAAIFAGKMPEDIGSQQYLQELMDGIAAFVDDASESGQPATLTGYLQDISLLSDQEEGETDEGNRITLMTVHSAKGLEFPVVFVVGMEEGLFPGERLTTERELEEERRLFYVAMTRAEHRLFISWSRSRVRYGQFANCTRSRFVGEIAADYLSASKGTGRSFFTHAEPSRPKPRVEERMTAWGEHP
ncbi:MAG: 3'-5' exonuclease, partial [Bacteroidaceae bacterium]|nr:3'-5' exonuclease [Bacteroidaceae bacterium]